MWSAVGNAVLPRTAPISSQFACSGLLYFPSAYVTYLFMPGPVFFNRNVLSDPTNGGKVFDLPKKRQGFVFLVDLTHQIGE